MRHTTIGSPELSVFLSTHNGVQDFVHGQVLDSSSFVPFFLGITGRVFGIRDSVAMGVVTDQANTFRSRVHGRTPVNTRPEYITARLVEYYRNED